MKRLAFSAAVLLLFAAWCGDYACAQDPPSTIGPSAQDIASWELQANGNLKFGYRVIGPRPDLFQVHIVRYLDRAPKLCGDPDGTGRYVWFFTDALAIERDPIPPRPHRLFEEAFNPVQPQEGEIEREP